MGGNLWYNARVLGRILRKRVPRTVIVAAASLAFMLGVFVAQWLRVYSLWPLLCMVPIVIISLRQHSTVALVFVVITAAFMGCIRGSPLADMRSLYDALDGQKVRLIGRVDSDSVYGRRSQLAIDVRDAAVLTESGPISLVGTLQVSGFGEPMLYKGDIVQVEGKLFKARGNAQARTSYAQITLVKRGGSWVDSLRRHFAAGMYSAVPEPLASFGMGLLIGQRNTLPQQTADELKAVGLTHIIAVSGYNLTIILRAAGRLLQSRSKFQYMAGSVGLMLVFLLMTGFSPPIVRASVVCGLGLLLWWYGRKMHPVTLVLLAAAITVAGNPLYVWGNVSWMLSFLAFFGVLVLGPIFTLRLYRGRTPGLVGAMVVETLCAELLTLPYVLLLFGQLSTVSLIANILIASFVPVAMVTSAIAGLAGMVMPVLAGWLSWPATVVMTYMLDMTHILANIPHALLENISFSPLAFCFSYMIIAGITAVAWHKGRQNGIITDNNDTS